MKRTVKGEKSDGLSTLGYQSADRNQTREVK